MRKWKLPLEHASMPKGYYWFKSKSCGTWGSPVWKSNVLFISHYSEALGPIMSPEEYEKMEWMCKAMEFAV